MARGILWVKSWIQNPNGITAEKLCEWYEETHIQEVLALSGFPSATRWVSLNHTRTTPGPWLVIFALPDVSYKDSSAFHAVQNTVPSQELIDSVYANVVFDIRFYEEVDFKERDDVEGEVGKFLDGEESSGEGGRVEKEEGKKGWLRTRRYKLLSQVVLKALNKEEGDAKEGLVLKEFGEGAEKSEGWLDLKRVYPQSEWESVGVE